MSTFLQSVVSFLEQNSGLVLAWVIIFQAVIGLCVLWLAYLVRSAPNAKTIQLAKESKEKVYAIGVKMDKLDAYVREEFSKDFNGAMKSFDDTATSVLGQMKDELIQGVQRIDQIQAAVSKKNVLEERVAEGQQGVQNLIKAPDEKIVDASQPAAGAESSAAVKEPVSAA